MDYSAIIEWHGPFRSTDELAAALDGNKEGVASQPFEGLYLLSERKLLGPHRLAYIGEAKNVVSRLKNPNHDQHGVIRRSLIFFGRISSPELAFLGAGQAEDSTNDDEGSEDLFGLALKKRRLHIEHILIYMLQPPRNKACRDQAPSGTRIIVNKYSARDAKRILRTQLPAVFSWRSVLGFDHVCYERPLLGNVWRRSSASSFAAIVRRIWLRFIHKLLALFPRWLGGTAAPTPFSCNVRKAGFRAAERPHLDPLDNF